ncbi:ORF3 [Lepus torque teno virus 1]|uniref:ORF3 n=1 Tax=Lepus torque teno virus 1 TaxID=2716318 RepID=A0A6G7NP38_9VIRU|nr:ORF3 [Lepus torque teno virus 1]QIJ55525.1 ORF3 [Lepus torque teno virus 1]
MRQTTTPAVYFGNRPCKESRKYRFVKQQKPTSVPSTAGRHREPHSRKRSYDSSTSDSEDDFEPSYTQMQREYTARRRRFEKRYKPYTSSEESGSTYSSSDTEPEGPQRLLWPETPCPDKAAAAAAWHKMAASV